jgi:ATP/ADP translocase
MTSKQEFQLIAPLIAGLGFFILASVWIGITGNLNRYTWKALLASAGLFAYALYLTVWQNELKELWHSVPLVLVAILVLSLGLPCGLFYWIWRVQVAAKAEQLGNS